MEMDEVIEVIGLAPLLRRNPLTGGPSPWLPHSNTPQELELRLRYKGYEYHAYLAGTREGAERLGLFREGSWLEGWAVKVVNVEGEPNPRGGGQTVDAVPTLEAAIVSALSSVYVLDHT